MIIEPELYKEKALLERYLGEIKRRNYVGKVAVRGLSKARKDFNLEEIAYYQSLFSESIPPAEIYWTVYALKYLEGREEKRRSPETIIYSMADNYDSKFSQFLKKMKEKNMFGEDKRRRLSIALDGKIFSKVTPFRIKEERDFFEYLVQWAQYFGLYSNGKNLERNVEENFEDMMKSVYNDVLEELRKTYGENRFGLFEYDLENLKKEIIAISKAVKENGYRIEDPEELKKEVKRLSKNIRKELKSFGKTIETGTNVILSIIDEMRRYGLLPQYRELYKRIER